MLSHTEIDVQGPHAAPCFLCCGSRGDPVEVFWDVDIREIGYVEETNNTYDLGEQPWRLFHFEPAHDVEHGRMSKQSGIVR